MARLAGSVLLIGVLAGCASSSSLDLTSALLQAPAWPLEAVQDAPLLDTDLLAQEIHARINATRHMHGIHDLAWVDDLEQLATAHSLDMTRHPFFGHTSPHGLAPADRARQAGLNTKSRGGAFVTEGVGENLFLTHRYKAYYIVDERYGCRSFVFDWKSANEIAEEAIDLWLQSHAHRENLLSPLYRAAGIGVVHTDYETLFVTLYL